MNALKQTLKEWSNFHRPSGDPNLLLFTVPRSGSTWLMELLHSQPGFKVCNEPFDLRNRHIRAHLPLKTWTELYNDAAQPIIADYLRGFVSGRLRFKNQSPLRPHYRPFTQRHIFKILHALEDRMAWATEQVNGRVIYLLRHPIAVTVSREQLPRLHAYLDSDYARHFTAVQIDAARRIIQEGDHLHRGVLSWCLQNSVPLRHRRPEWLTVTYEQMVLHPDPILHALAGRLDLPQPQKLHAHLSVPSGTVTKSDAQTQHRLQQPRTAQNKQWLVRKWRDKVTAEQEESAMKILDIFEIDVYQAHQLMPHETYQIPAEESA